MNVYIVYWLPGGHRTSNPEFLSQDVGTSLHNQQFTTRNRGDGRAFLTVPYIAFRTALQYHPCS